MAKNRIVIGNDVYTDTDIRNGNVYLSSSLAADELSIDTLDVTADVTSIMATIFKPKDVDGMIVKENKLYGVMPHFIIVSKYPVEYQYAQLVQYYHRDKLFGTFYLSSVERTGKYTYAISCISAIGLLDNSTHYGGIYDGVKFETLAKDIVGENMTCTVTNEIKDILIYGHLPIATRRENLHHLLFATGTTVETGEKNGKPTINIVALTDSDPKKIDASSIYIGGSVDLNKQISRVIVTEHAYTKTYNEERFQTLYEGAVEATTITTPKGKVVDGALITFSNPSHTLSFYEPEGAMPEILEQNANYAVLAPIGYCKLVGYEYNHTTRQITREVGAKTRALVNVQDNDAVVDNATLVSLANSENVADRVMAYYTSAKNIKVDLIAEAEDKPGKRISFADPFDDTATGYIKSMDITMSGKLKANSEVVEGYVPTGIGNNYKNVEILNDVHNWLCPPNVYKIRLVLIGGGKGGWSGYPGENGTGGFLDADREGEDGEGGNPGQGGSGGDIYIATINVIPGKFYTTKFGIGGNGGSKSFEGSTEGEYGKETTFSNEELGVFCSSSMGSPSKNGYVDVIFGNTYALPGKEGHSKGGKRGDLIPYVTSSGISQFYTSGSDGNSTNYEILDWSADAQGGHGGGPSYGGNGKPGADGYISKNIGGFATGGAGGDGADGATGEKGTGIGDGGQGGSGGGGGGGGGSAWHSAGNRQTAGRGGSGGKGGSGGRGGNGGIIIYY